MQRRALALLFFVIAASIAGIGIYAGLSGGRAWIVAFAATGLALWMADLARRAWKGR